MRRILLLLILVACQRDESPPQSDIGSAKAAPINATTTTPKVEQVTPKLDVQKPPADAVKTASGLTYKKLVEKPDGAKPARNDTVLINYTGWKQSTGETFFTNRAQGQPLALNLAQTAAGFTEALQLVGKGETVMLWIPPNIGYKAPPQGKAETLVYELELVDIVRAPAVPPDYNAPPANAKVLPSGAKLVIVKPGTKERARAFDTVTFDYTAWDKDGRMFASTEMRKRPATLAPFKQPIVMQEILTAVAKGERARLWVDGEQMSPGPAAGVPKGQLCYELEIKDIEKAAGTPPPVPADVKAPPADAKKTAKGVAYKLLKAGRGGPKPGPTDQLVVNYTGWTTDGRMFDTSFVKGKPAQLAMNGVIAGWTDGLAVASAGDHIRLWIPEELAYKGAPGKPQGMLVFDIELVEVKGATHDDGHGHAQTTPAPSDVAAPPKHAKKSPKGVSYKLLAPAKKGAAKPTSADTVKVRYTGWTTDGKQFDAGETSFALTDVIAGWTDTFPLLGVGDKARLWIPEALAYQGQAGAPAGMLVFDVELLDIIKSTP